MKIPLLLTVTGLLVAACTTPSSHTRSSTVADRPTTPPPPPPKTTAAIEVLSEPPGARIEVNDSYVGETPCTIEIPFYSDNRFREQTVIRALPTRDGYTQSKFFSGCAHLDNPYLQPDKIPQRIFFDTRLRPVSRDFNLNIQNQ